MHELAVTESILNIVLRHAEQAQSKRVTDIYLVIGDLASIVDDSVQFYWEILAKETLAAGARLHFRRINTEMACQNCGCRYAPEDLEMACPNCHSIDIRVVAGEEFYVQAIDVES